MSYGNRCWSRPKVSGLECMVGYSRAIPGSALRFASRIVPVKASYRNVARKL